MVKWRGFCAKAKRTPLTLLQQALSRLEAYRRPGNVRELQNVIERSIYFCPDQETELKEILLGAESELGWDYSRLSMKEHLDHLELNLSTKYGDATFRSEVTSERHCFFLARRRNCLPIIVFLQSQIILIFHIFFNTANKKTDKINVVVKNG